MDIMLLGQKNSSPTNGFCSAFILYPLLRFFKVIKNYADQYK